MKHRSPIEMMVDQACGFDPSKEQPVQNIQRLDEATKALLEVADAAKSWRNGFVPRTSREKRLVAAVDKWVLHGG